MKKLVCLFAWLIVSHAAAQPALHLKGLKRDLSQPSVLDGAQQSRTLGRSHLLVQFAHNPSGDQLTELQNRGAALLSYVPDFALSISAQDDTALDGLDLEWIGRLQPKEKISPELKGALTLPEVWVLVEFYSDVDPNDVRTIANEAGLLLHESPDLAANHLLVSGTGDQVRAITEWDEVAYIFLASADLVQGTPVRGCASALTSLGQVSQAVPTVGDGWDGPGQGAADLKYAFVHLPDVLPDYAAKAEIVRAFSEWAKYVKVTFTPTSNATGSRTLAILFASRAHGDPYPFDGPGGLLAHTYYPFPLNPEPIAGDMHFDNDESWRIGSDIDLFSIALHEAGHALGLGHSDKPGSVMYPYYHRHTALTADDISAIVQLYAAQEGAANPIPPIPPVTPPAPTGPLVLTVQTPANPTIATSIALGGTTSGGSGSIQVNWSTNRGSSGVAQGSSNWTVSGLPLSVGDNIITITARDSSLNQVVHNLMITRQQQSPPSGPDTTPPSLTILSPSTSNPSTSESSLILRGTASDNVGVAAVMWSSSTGGSGTANGTDNWTTPSIALYMGTTTVTIRASDAAGNTSWRSVIVTRR